MSKNIRDRLDDLTAFRKAIREMSFGHIMQNGGDYYRINMSLDRKSCVFQMRCPEAFSDIDNDWTPAYWISLPYLPLGGWKSVSDAMTKRILDQVGEKEE